MKKTALAAAVMTAVMLFSGCSGFGADISDSLSPPKPSGELYEIQQALEASVGQDIDLVYPASGEYRSAIITKDIDADGKYEVFSFYSTETDDKTTVMHMNYIRWINEEWVSVGEQRVDASGVHSVEFANLDNSGVLKVLVNWNRYSAANKQLSVYGTDGGELTELAKADYSVYATGDFDSNGVSEIIAVHLDTENKISTATLLGLGPDGFSDMSRCRLDGTVTSYYTPRLSKFTDGTSAMFLDADKATGMITEMLYIAEDNTLVSAVPYTSTFENVNTLRASSVKSEDFDGDGCIDIPLAQKLPTVAAVNDADSVYMTVWNSFDGTSLSPIGYTVINYTDGYRFDIPETWIGNIAVERRTDLRQRTFYRWDSELSETGEEILSIRAVALKDWENGNVDFTSFKEFARTSDEVYILRFGNSALSCDEAYCTEHFKILGKQDGEKKR